ncbi:MAG: dTDP-glucose 4,6-dehydratase [Thermodesulfobacteriota bacterium]
MKNLLVTGGAGFIGVNFIRYLLEESDFEGRIINVDKLTYAANPQSLSDIEKSYDDRYIFVKADIADKESLTKVFDMYEVDSICHLAAESHVDRSIASPIEFIQTNILGTYNLLELSRERGGRIKLFHHVSTDEVFGSLEDGGLFTEKTPYNPNSPYSASKASSDHLVRAYNKTFELPITISNCSNNYGPFQFPEKLIPLMISNALEDTALPVYGDGLNIRDWLFVRDHCTAIWKIMKRGTRGETYNIGGRNEIENVKVVEMICDYLDVIVGTRENREPRRALISFVTDRPGHDRRYAIDSNKITSRLGWMPEESFETGLLKTIKWYLDNKGWLESVRSGDYRKWISEHYG